MSDGSNSYQPTGADSAPSRTRASFNQEYYNYVNNPIAVLRSNALCMGPDTRVGGLCGYYGGLRQTIASDDPSRPLYFHRHIMSSGDPQNAITAEVPPSAPRNLSPDQQRMINRGLGLVSYDTRDWEGNSQLLTSSILADYRSRNNRMNVGFQGVWGTLGVGQPTRQVATSASAERFRETQNRGPSRASYGSYGVW